MRPGPDELLHFSEDPTITVFEPRVAPTAQVPGAYVWVATEAVSPLGPAEPAGDLLELHREAGIQLRLVDSLWPWWDAVTASSVAFFPGRCPLPGMLRERGIDTVLITGTVTNVCCESSARDASTLGFRVIMVADGNAAMRDRDHNATPHTTYRTFGDVRPTAEVLELIGVADGA